MHSTRNTSTHQTATSQPGVGARVRVACGVSALVLLLAPAAWGKAETVLPSVQAPGAQCVGLEMALGAKPKLEQRLQAWLSAPMRAEYQRLKGQVRPSAEAFRYTAPSCARLLYPSKTVQQVQACGPSTKAVLVLASLHHSGASRREALSVAPSLGAEPSGDGTPSALSQRMVDFAYSHSPNNLSEPEMALRVSGAWLDQCLSEAK